MRQKEKHGNTGPYLPVFSLKKKKSPGLMPKKTSPFNKKHTLAFLKTTVSDSLVIIPTYNEKENIERMLNKVFSLTKVFHVLVVDDGSPDGTADIVKAKMQEFPDRLFIEER